MASGAYVCVFAIWSAATVCAGDAPKPPVGPALTPPSTAATTGHPPEEQIGAPRVEDAGSGTNAPKPLPSAPPKMLNSAVLHRAAEQLKADMAGLAEEREALGKELNAAPANRSEEIGRLKGRLESLLHEFQQRSRGSAKPAAAEAVVAQPAPPAPPSRAEKPAEKPVEKPREEHQETKPPEAPAGKPVDAPALAHALFQNGDYDGALQAYRLVDVKTLNPEERAAIQYMTATCLRRLGKFDDASVLYREVANSKTSEVLVECAQWQLNSIAWRKDLESQLEQLRERRKAVESKP